ncbi:hypothetical protein I307_06528 [Cryptococcus deuterogattii 99/473]|uniref:Uncharacterized protein n=1 Tax=Cryptococcus deuterogattii Ram5 TaxID=1296110 RepID=A0A0D0TVH8_9TREE|nr:hypothetical protein I309_06404 [Cryptococcus deuterogattii LA55]KIR39923.1 hypothetical protein I313_03842 [Cryptococcus deuterogattii Ram5]KIR71316.1 hypothetical protein I310_04621 [Cryptococcus deuterogattii CA1014]KIR90896.1 hypothetical protein I304_04990 [Cryptococcus deuterogattii CBS 10090]KIY54158.1 hypothetical protein I307_06528 [Cryptococcus deuterogattii 99/473]
MDGHPMIQLHPILTHVATIPAIAIASYKALNASDVAFPTPRSVRYHQPKPESPMTISFAFEGDKKTAWKIEILRQSLSLFTTIGILYFTWAGYTYFHPIIAAAYLILAIGTLRYPIMSIRRVIQIMCAYLILVPVLSIIIGVVVQQFTGNSQDEEGTDKKDNVTLASDWVLSLIFILGHILGPMIPSIITAMTLRFEYTLVNEPIERSSETSSEAPVRIPNEYPSFPKPIFLSSLFSLFTSIVIIETITYTIPDLFWLSITPVSVFITVPIVVGGTALGAAWCVYIGFDY